MTEETQNLFSAPWEADVCCEIHDKNESLICICCPGEPHIANRLARLPELYDALAETIEEHCDLCINFTGDKPKLLIEEILKFGCLAKSKTCHCVKKIELLRKVRDGE